MGGSINSVLGVFGRCLVCVKFDKKIVTYVNITGKGYKEDFDFEELEAAIELYKEHEEEDK